MVETKELVTRAEYARRKGWTRPYITKLVKQGKVHIDENGKINPAEADRMLAENRDPSRDPFRKQGNGDSENILPHEDDIPEEILSRHPGYSETFLKVRIAKEKYSAALKKIEYEEKIGKLIEIVQVEKLIFEKNRLIRNMIQNIPDRFAAVMAAELGVKKKDFSKVHNILFQEIESILGEMAQVGK